MQEPLSTAVRLQKNKLYPIIIKRVQGVLPLEIMNSSSIQKTQPKPEN